MDYNVLLYYNFVPVENPEEAREEHFEICKSLNLKGRILIAKEGLNGTVSGLKADTDAYMEWIHQHPVFKNTEFKIDEYHKHTFLKLHVRVKNEIVRLNIPEAVNQFGTTPHVTPEEFLKAVKEAQQNPDIVILDARSAYEYSVGKFKGAVTLDIDNFRDLPEQRAELEKLQGKKIYTYCTGGIKCEKVSGWLKEHFNPEEIYQLHGGIVNYGKVTGGEDFEGQCYVFDQRVVVPVNQVNPTVIGKCGICSKPAEKMINCANASCNEHFTICEECFHEMEGCCSKSCMESPDRRAFNDQGYFLRGVNSKIYVNK
ncbi:MAG: rhodanese-related sulfurtransferase [Bacteroidia bacterium]|nr:rhodanese-related sulfurtransferase [Bacteroidia bacterium]